MHAPLPFLLPWLLTQSHSYALNDTLFHPLLQPHDWRQGDWGAMLRSNLALWSICYGTAALVYYAACLTPARSWKFNTKFPAASMVATEIARSIGGVMVLTLYQ